MRDNHSPQRSHLNAAVTWLFLIPFQDRHLPVILTLAASWYNGRLMEKTCLYVCLEIGG